jgi:hypothetical protein
MRALQFAVGIAALVAPALHSISDLMEWTGGGFSAGQLWLNYAAFLPMPWLLLGLHAVHPRPPGILGLVGALLYGAAFTYFAHTTLLALAERTPDYEALWQQLGFAYTLHGALMVAGGLMFAAAMLRARWLPRAAVVLFGLGTLANLVLALLPTPDVLQGFGSAVRNAGLVAMGCAVLRGRGPPQRTASTTASNT